jgi:hypothetical protein
MSIPLRDLDIKLKTLSSDDAKDLIYETTHFTPDSLFTIKTEKITRSYDNVIQIYCKTIDTNDAYDSYFTDVITVEHDTNQLVIHSYLIWNSSELENRFYAISGQ